MSDNRKIILDRLEKEELDRIEGYEKHNRRENDPLEKDFAEQATQRENDDVVNSLLDGARRRLQQVRHARERVEAGEGNICETCGGPIASERLAALPSTTVCSDCAKEEDA
jgi:DnaK suppressor protein